VSRARGAAFVLAAALAAHVASLRAGWVLDDWELLVENPYLRSTQGLGVVLTRELFVATAEPRLVPYYRPVTSFVYWLTYMLFGPSPLLHHLFNVALHGTSAVLFYLLLRALEIAPRAATALGILFAIHPISAEVVAYTGGRQDVLGWIFTFASLLLVLRSPKPARTFVVALAGTLLAALTREFFLSAPALLVVAAACSAQRPRSRAAIAAGAGGALAIAAVFALRSALHIVPFEAGPKTVERMIGACAVVLLRLAKDVVAPTDIAVDVTVQPLGAGGGFLVLVVTAAAFVAGLRLVRARAAHALPAFVLGGVALGLLAVMHTPVAMRYGVFSDRYAYGGAVAALLLLAPAADALAKKIAPEKAKLYAGLFVAVSVAVIPITWARAADYASDETLAEAMVRERPDDPQALLARIAALRGAGKKAEAYPLCHRYAELLPKAIAVSPCLAEEAIAAKDYARAAVLLEPWVYSRPGDVAARSMYFEASFRTGDLPRVQKALEYFEPVEPNAPDVRAAREAFDRARAK
jgi:protein O-mannosyl-transferase